jgi:hypothetical protein
MLQEMWTASLSLHSAYLNHLLASLDTVFQK